MANLTLNGTTRAVSVEKLPDGTLAVTVDGRRHVVSNVDASAHTLSFALGSRACVATVSRTTAATTLSLAGHQYVSEHVSVDTDRPATSGGSGGNGTLTAPMPGAIIAVHVASGDTVRAGQPVVVLESMKMHNEIVSPMDGVVKAVNCKPGEQVPYGHVLAEITAQAS